MTNEQEKQIRHEKVNELAKIISLNSNFCKSRGDCYECPIFKKNTCEYVASAQELYDLGYRKESEVVAEVLSAIHEEIRLALKSNYKARQERIEKHYNGMYGVYDNFISLVDGKINALRGIQDFLAELEKKYIGE